MMKQELYACLIEQMRKADAASYHFEAITLAYAVLEDRTTSMLKALGKQSGGESLHNKTVALAWRAGEKDSALGVYFQNGVLVALKPEDQKKARLRGMKTGRTVVEKVEDKNQVAKFSVWSAP